MRQATFIAVFVLLLAATSLCARGEIVNGSFEDSPDLNGWTIVTGTPAVRASFQEVVNEVLVHDFEPVEGAKFAILDASTIAFMTPLTQAASALEQEFSAGVGDELAFEYFAFGKTFSVPPSSATSNATVLLTNLSTNDSTALVDRNMIYDTGFDDWVAVSHTFAAAADYRLTIRVGVTASSLAFPPADAQATLGIDNVRLIAASLLSDLTGNGFVDFQDLTVLLANWNQDVTVQEGNLVDPLTTPVNFQDLTVLLADWTGPGPAGSPPGGGQLVAAAAVPEPSGLLLAAIGMLGLLGFGRRSLSAGKVDAASCRVMR